jgi:hypothetical protein
VNGTEASLLKTTTTKVKTVKAKTIKVMTPKAPREPKIIVSDANIGRAAMRLLSQRLVSTEVHYVQRQLGRSATQQDIDTQVIAVRKLPWTSIQVAD